MGGGGWWWGGGGAGSGGGGGEVVQRVPQSQTVSLPRHQEETDKSKQAKIEQTYEKDKEAQLLYLGYTGIYIILLISA